MEAEQTTRSAPTVEQWARAQAVRALLGRPNAAERGPSAIAEQVGVYAHLIITGELPAPKPGTYHQ